MKKITILLILVAVPATWSFIWMPENDFKLNSLRVEQFFKFKTSPPDEKFSPHSQPDLDTPKELQTFDDNFFADPRNELLALAVLWLLLLCQTSHWIWNGF